MDTFSKIMSANPQWPIALKLMQKQEPVNSVLKITYFQDTDAFQHTLIQSSVMCTIQMANVYSAKKVLPVLKEFVIRREKYKKFTPVKMSGLEELSR